jgi:hypothetical protein
MCGTQPPMINAIALGNPTNRAIFQPGSAAVGKDLYPDGPIAVEALRVIGAAMAEAGVVGIGSRRRYLPAEDQ